MKATLATINRMQADGVIGSYAIGGAVGATFYIEPSATLDIDIFVSLRQAPGQPIVSLQPIHDYLLKRNCAAQGEYIIIAGWQVRFLPPGDSLGEEALSEAVETDIEGTKTWVMTAEHLVALAVRLGRAKDHARILQFIEAGVLNPAKLDQTLARHGLLEKWERFGDKFLRNE
jgi:hypothetical protein